MKKLLLISLMILAICLCGCDKNKPTEVLENSGEIKTENLEHSGEIQDKTNEVTSVSGENEMLNKSFEERTKEARNWMNQEDKLGIDDLGYISKEHFVDSASLEKRDDYYVMKLDFSSSKLFDKEEIENAYNLAQENGTYSYEQFTFYKDNNLPIPEEYMYNEDNLKNQIIPSMKNKGILASSADYPFLIFMKTPLNSSKYCLAWQMMAGADGFIQTEKEKTIEVILLPDDEVNIIINHESNGGVVALSVKDFSEKAVNAESIELPGYSDSLQLDLAYIGSAMESFGDYQNAVEFTDKVVANYTIGGV